MSKLISIPTRAKLLTWDWEVNQKAKWWSLELDELWAYRSLLTRLVRRDFLVSYQQTILGPLWTLLTPVITVATYVLVFGKLVGLSTGSVPAPLFYLIGTILWNYFNDSFSTASNTFILNGELFSKVYFPRLVVPLAALSANFLRLLIQCSLALLVLIYFWLFQGLPFRIGVSLLLIPIDLFIISGVSLATGLIFAVITTKYRDLTNVVQLGLRMVMFVTPVIYPVSIISKQAQWLINLNPLTPAFESFRYALFGEGSFDTVQLMYSLIVTIMLLIAGIFLFNQQKEILMDVV